MAKLKRIRTRDLCKAARAGVRFIGDGKMEADVLRRLVLNLPLQGSQACKLTPVGIEIHDARIDGRLVLDRVVMPDGGPAAPLEFHNCVFTQGFSGAHGRFSRLGFHDCRFRDPPAQEEGSPKPTIDLSGATIDSGLALRAILPDRARDHLWIRAPDARIGGALDLSCSLLRAPRDDMARRLVCDPPVAALDLARADVGGDLYFMNGGRCEGPIRARGVHIHGDLWLSGLTIDVDEGPGLFLQAATIDGMAMLLGMGDRADSSGTFRHFVCSGDLSLRAAEIGDDLHMEYAAVAGKANFLDLTVKNDLIFGTSVRGSIDLAGCRIGGTLDLSGLIVGESFTKLDLKAGTIGRSLKRLSSLADCELVAARRDFLASMPGAQLLETLWIYKSKSHPDRLVQVGFLTDGRRIIRLDGFASGVNAAVRKFRHAVEDSARAIEFLRLYGTYCHGEDAFPVLTDSDPSKHPPFIGVASGQAEPVEVPPAFFEPAQKKLAAKPEGQGRGFVIEACILHNGQLCRRRFRVVPEQKAVRVVPLNFIRDGPLFERVPRFRGPFIFHPDMEMAERKRAIAGRTWATGLTLDGLRECPADELSRLEKQLAPLILSAFSLRGMLDLENLGCDMLDDQAGRYWGHKVELELNHFVYNRASWEPRPARPVPPKKKRKRGIGPVAREWAQRATAEYREARASLWKKLKRGAAERLPVWLADLFGWTKRLRLGDHWTPWEIRRNWVYQQFGVAPIKRLTSPARYRIDSAEYRPQPFEQAIKVARAEGREDFAIHFEILKRNIEWRLFSRRNWEWFAFLGAFGAAAWLIFHRHELTREIWIAAILIGLVLAFISPICHAIMNRFFGHLRRPVRAIATLAVAFLLGWAGVHAANERGLMVVDVEPVATLVGENPADDPAGNQKVVVIGSPRRVGKEDLASHVPCGDTISEPLYALDVLVPLIDLREEDRCEIDRAAPRANGVTYARGGILGELEELAGGGATFWEVLKAIYAIAGWFIVSLSILTFAQITRARSDPS